MVLLLTEWNEFGITFYMMGEAGGLGLVLRSFIAITTMTECCFMSELVSMR